MHKAEVDALARSGSGTLPNEGDGNCAVHTYAHLAGVLGPAQTAPPARDVQQLRKALANALFSMVSGGRFSTVAQFQMLARRSSADSACSTAEHALATPLAKALDLDCGSKGYSAQWFEVLADELSRVADPAKR